MKQAVVELDDFKVTINELRIKDIRKVISNIQEVFGDEDLNMQKLVDEKFDIIMEICSGFIKVPNEHSLDELTFSDIEKLTPKFKEVNKSFLDKMALMDLTPQYLMDQAETSGEDSTTP